MKHSVKSMRAADIQESIRRILCEDWDPIGVCGKAPSDEYDTYIGGVYRILADTRSEDDLLDFLTRVEIEYMGFSPPVRDTLRPVARKLLELDIKLHDLSP